MLHPSSLPPASGPVTPPGSQAVLIPCFTARWLIRNLSIIFVLDAIVLSGMALMFMRPWDLPMILPMLMIPLVGIMATPLSGRWLEKRLDSLPSRPGEAPGKVVVHWAGLAMYGLPRIQGALALTGSELVFYRRRFRRWVEQMRIPLTEIASVRAGKGLYYPKLALAFHNGGIMAFQVVYAERWRDAVLEVRDKA